VDLVNDALEAKFQDENFQKLTNSEIGDNLMHKYQAVASLHLWPYLCKAAMEATRRMLLDRGVLVYDDIRQFGRIELSDQFASPVGTIKRRLHVARKRLARELATMAP
jgi:hypothetical protein